MQNELSISYWENEFLSYLQAHYNGDDGAHDIKHFQRVWKTCKYINAKEGSLADELVLLAASYFHDIVTLPKDNPDRHLASKLSAEKAVSIFQENFPLFPENKLNSIAHAIHAHSFSACVQSLTLEAKILQDADRMEALGAIGLARVFYIAGMVHSSLFHSSDPFAILRNLDDKQYAIDHFAVKLFKLPGLMNTTTGKALAQKKADYLRDFLDKLREELDGYE